MRSWGGHPHGSRIRRAGAGPEAAWPPPIVLPHRGCAEARTGDVTRGAATCAHGTGTRALSGENLAISRAQGRGGRAVPARRCPSCRRTASEMCGHLFPWGAGRIASDTRMHVPGSGGGGTRRPTNTALHERKHKFFARQFQRGRNRSSARLCRKGPRRGNRELWRTGGESANVTGSSNTP